MGGYRSIYAVVLLMLASCAENSITMLDARGNPITFKQSAGGRSCIAASTKDGELDVIIQQDGSSDWGIFRAVEWLGNAAATVFGGAGNADPDGPSIVAGCQGIFETGASVEGPRYELRPVQP